MGSVEERRGEIVKGHSKMEEELVPTFFVYLN